MYFSVNWPFHFHALNFPPSVLTVCPSPEGRSLPCSLLGPISMHPPTTPPLHLPGVKGSVRTFCFSPLQRRCVWVCVHVKQAEPDLTFTPRYENTRGGGRSECVWELFCTSVWPLHACLSVCPCVSVCLQKSLCSHRSDCVCCAGCPWERLEAFLFWIPPGQLS